MKNSLTSESVMYLKNRMLSVWTDWCLKYMLQEVFNIIFVMTVSEVCHNMKGMACTMTAEGFMLCDF